MNPFQMVKEFHQKYDCAINEPFTNLGLALRHDLIEEEFNEVNDEMFSYNRIPICKQQLTKELADLIYVTIGTAVAFGLPLEEVFTEVHNSNMTKTLDNKREDGKILKGPDYKKPNLEQFFA